MSNESTKPDVVTNEQQCAALHLPLWAVLDVWKFISDSGSTQAGCNSSTTPCTMGTAILLQGVVGILQRCEARLLEMADMEKMVAFLRTEVPQWRHDALQVSFPAA